MLTLKFIQSFNVDLEAAEHNTQEMLSYIQCVMLYESLRDLELTK